MPKSDPEADLIEEQTLDGMKIMRIGRGHYFAQSMSQPETAYAVDLADYGGLGSCTCVNFSTLRLPRWREVRLPYNAFRCKHIMKVRTHVLDQIIAFYRNPKEHKPQT